MSLRTRRRERRQYKADPLDRGLDILEAENDTQETWLGDLTGEHPAVITDITPDPLPVPPRRPQTLYAVGRTCFCGTPTTGDFCVAHRDFPLETVHACPPDGSGETPCCDRTPFELPATDRLSADPEFVTCPPPASWLSLVSDEPLTQAETRKLLTAIFSCDLCGARLDHSGLCEDYGAAHASPQHAAAIASWGPGDTPVQRPHRGGAA